MGHLLLDLELPTSQTPIDIPCYISLCTRPPVTMYDIPIYLCSSWVIWEFGLVRLIHQYLSGSTSIWDPHFVMRVNNPRLSMSKDEICSIVLSFFQFFLWLLHSELSWSFLPLRWLSSSLSIRPLSAYKSSCELMHQLLHWPYLGGKGFCNHSHSLHLTINTTSCLSWADPLGILGFCGHYKWCITLHTSNASKKWDQRPLLSTLDRVLGN